MGVIISQQVIRFGKEEKKKTGKNEMNTNHFYSKSETFTEQCQKHRN